VARASFCQPYTPGASSASKRSPAGEPARSQASGRSLKVQNAYEAASQGRRLKIWSPGSLGPNNSILNDLNLLRERSRDATRNNAWIKKGINVRQHADHQGSLQDRDCLR
jgi:capsid protein